MALRRCGCETADVFGRVRRAVAGENAGEYAVLHAFSPETVAGTLAVGMGAAGVGSGAAIARTADGRQVSALAEAVSGTMDWVDENSVASFDCRAEC